MAPLVYQGAGHGSCQDRWLAPISCGGGKKDAVAMAKSAIKVCRGREAREQYRREHGHLISTSSNSPATALLYPRRRLRQFPDRLPCVESATPAVFMAAVLSIELGNVEKVAHYIAGMRGNGPG